MDEQVVSCPYCALGGHFQRMLPRREGWFICLNCGHSANSEKPESKCFCRKCGELNRVA